MGLFSRSKSIGESGLLNGATDNHCHILYGVDDGVRSPDESLSILDWYEKQGLKELWFTPHVMDDVPNTTEGLKTRFNELCDIYKGGLKFHLAAEYMLDNVFEERLAARDFLFHGEDRVLVETSTVFPPVDLWDMLRRMMSAGYRPLLAHPERYRYMEWRDYERLREMGVQMQLNIPSIVGVYGETTKRKAIDLLKAGMYCMAGSDCHRFRALRFQSEARELKKDTVKMLEPLMKTV